MRPKIPFPPDLLPRCLSAARWPASHSDHRWALRLKRPAPMDSSGRSCPRACGAGYTLRHGAHPRPAAALPRSGTVGTRGPARGAGRGAAPLFRCRSWSAICHTAAAQCSAPPLRRLRTARRPGLARTGRTFSECSPSTPTACAMAVGAIAGRPSASGKCGAASDRWRPRRVAQMHSGHARTTPRTATPVPHTAAGGGGAHTTRRALKSRAARIDKAGPLIN